MDRIAGSTEGRVAEYVSVSIAGQLFGIPIVRVRDVFIPGKLTRVPLAGPEIAGILNLRGRIVTTIDMRRCLDLPARETGEPPMAVGVEHDGESYGLVIDAVGEILELPVDEHEPVPVNLDARLARMAKAVHRLEGQLLVILDVDRVLDVENRVAAA